MAVDRSPTLDERIVSWGKDKASADLLNLQWAAIQGQYYKSENSIKYVTKGSIIACDSGALFSRIDLPIDHGVETKGSHLPLLTTADFGSENIPNFGICKEQSSDTITYYCHTQISTQWQQSERNTAANKAALLQADAFAICSKGGIISIKEINKTPQESLMAIFREQYGFDERTVKLILDVHQKIQTKYSDESQLKRDWRFARLLGEFYYAIVEEHGWAEEAKWNHTAGDASTRIVTKTNPGYSISAPLGISLRDYMIGELDMSTEDFEFLKYKTRIQHAMAGESAEKRKYDPNRKYTDEEITTLSAYEKMNTGLGGIDGVTEFINVWNQQCDDMCGKTDFCHQQITTATILATKLDYASKVANTAAGGERKREQKAGWLGDATIRGKEGVIKFGNDDYMSDLDAENIANMVIDGSYSYITAIEYYYGESLLEDNRAQQFLAITPISEVKELIYNELIQPIYLRKLSEVSNAQEIEQLKSQFNNEDFWMDLIKTEISAGTYNFIRSLEQTPPLPELGDFQ